VHSIEQCYEEAIQKVTFITKRKRKDKKKEVVEKFEVYFHEN
jgi:hypothetical protein